MFKYTLRLLINQVAFQQRSQISMQWRITFNEWIKFGILCR